MKIDPPKILFKKLFISINLIPTSFAMTSSYQNPTSFLLHNLNRALSNPLQKDRMANVLLEICDSFYQNPVHNLQDMKLRNTKVKGDIFESFAQLYLKHIYGFQEVWLLKEIPREVRTTLNLQTLDTGIDLVARDDKQKYYAIQAKFRKHPPPPCTVNVGNQKPVTRKRVVQTWKSLSTFYAMCARTGPFEKYIVFTTADYVRRMGHKSEKDLTINFHKFEKMTHFDWMKLIQSTPLETTHPSSNQTINSQKQHSLSTSRETLRQKRLLFYDRQKTTETI